MSRKHHWTPQTLEERIDRIESLEQIRQLPHRYALCIDLRNIDDLVELFVEDVRVGKSEAGRKALGRWFSDMLGFRCRLVYMPNNTNRIVNPDYVKNKIVSFADNYPLLIIGEESLGDLNKRLEIPLPMNRFRTNFVFSGGNPFDVDHWEEFQIGEVKFQAVKPCSRCVITTTDQDTAERADEPLKTLATYRKQNGNVMFGMNVIPESPGEINVGNEIKLITR